MLVVLFVFLLLFFFGAYMGLDILRFTGNDIQVMGYSLSSLQTAEFRAALGVAILSCEFVIVLFSLLFHMADTLRDVIKPLARLIPLGLFLLSLYRAFAPLIISILPTEITGAAPVDPMAYMVKAAADGTLTRTLLFSLGSMLLFVLANRALATESPEIRAMRAELAKRKSAK